MKEFDGFKEKLCYLISLLNQLSFGVYRGIWVGQEQNQENILGSGRGEKLPDGLGQLGHWNWREGYRFDVSVEIELTKLAYRLNLTAG